MTIESIEIELDMTTATADLAGSIELSLQKLGEPLRWAITAVDPATNIAKIEAIVIKE
jgi:hypothetical protein